MGNHLTYGTTEKQRNKIFKLENYSPLKSGEMSIIKSQSKNLAKRLIMLYRM